jgi:hypothetical protein
MGHATRKVALVAGVALLASGLALLAWGDGDSGRTRHTTVLDERRGLYRGIAIGDPESKVRRRFGVPDRADRDGECDLCPAGTTVDDDLAVPTIVEFPRHTPRGTEHDLRYRDVVFMTARGRVYGLLVTDRRATTRRGVGIGHPVRRAAERYKTLDCGIANERSEYPTFPYCVGRLDRLYVSFGGNPIKSITISTTRLTG